MLLYLTRDLGLTPGAIGVIFAVSSIGFLVGAVSATRLADLATPAIGATPLVGTAPLAVALVLIAAQFVFGLAVITFTVTAGSLRQVVTPDALRGRMNATTRVLVWA